MAIRASEGPDEPPERTSGIEDDLEPRPRFPWWPALGAWLAAAIVFFRDPLWSRFDTITGDQGDLRLVVFLHEHWWEVVQGRASWLSPPMFHPVHGTLGYSDTFALSQLVYVPLRAVGVESFAAFQLTLIGYTLVGFLSVVALARCHLELPVIIACLLAVPVAFGNNLYVATPHTQLYGANVVPAVVLLGVSAWRSTSRRRARMYATGSGLLLALLMWSTFYFGWFAMLLGCVSLISAACILSIFGRFRQWVDVVAARWQLIAVWWLGFGVGIVPFVATYAPVLDQSGSRSYSEVAGLAPRIGDVINVGRHNLIWGRLVTAVLGDGARVDDIHRAVAVTPLLVVAAAVAAVVLVRRAWHARSIDAVGTIGLASAATLAFAIVLPLQFDVGGLWAWAHRFVPGGGAIRVYSRIEIVADFLAVITVACWASTVPRERARAGRYSTRWNVRALMLGALVLVAVEQVNTTTVLRQLDRSDELARLAAVPPPPEGCTSFFVVDPTREREVWVQIDAMLIAHEVGLPTLNGYSGQAPPGWDLRAVGSPLYSSAVADWVARSGVDPDSVCSYSTPTSEWSTGIGP